MTTKKSVYAQLKAATAVTTSPITNYVRRIEAVAGPSAVVKGAGNVKLTLNKTLPTFEQAHYLPDQSLLTKVDVLHFRGSLADFQLGKGICCVVEPSVDQNSENAKLQLLNSNITTIFNDVGMPVKLHWVGQHTNTEYRASKIISSIAEHQASVASSIECPPAEKDVASQLFSAVIPQAPTTAQVNLPLYDRKQNVKMGEMRNWVGVGMDRIMSDILEVNPEDGIAIVRHSEERPSAIHSVLKDSVDNGLYTSQTAGPGEPLSLPINYEQPGHPNGETIKAHLISIPDVNWSIAHIESRSKDPNIFANLGESYAYIRPFSGEWIPSADNTKKVKGGIGKGITLGSNDMLNNARVCSVFVTIKHDYVVCSDVQDEYDDEEQGFADENSS